jgi:hypothetical protein
LAVARHGLLRGGHRGAASTATDDDATAADGIPAVVTGCAR